MKKFLAWVELKSLVINAHIPLKYLDLSSHYYIFTVDGGIEFYTEIWKDTTKIKGIDINQNNSDLSEFEASYKANCSATIDPISSDGKKIVRAESRPIDCTTVFTSIGDSGSGIADGKRLTWDFSTDDDTITAPENYKRKRLEFGFLDPVYIKEGTLYFHNAEKGSYIDLYVVCPTGAYYLDNNGVPKQATEDTIISHYMISQFFQGTCQMGDEFNTEVCSEQVPSYLKFWLDITVPDTDNLSNGYISIEMYRQRTRIL